MKEFDLEKAKAGAPVCTRDGRPARIICWDAKSENPIIALIKDESGREFTRWYDTDGKFVKKYRTDEDLMMPEHKGWINIIRTKTPTYYTAVTIHESEECALEAAKSLRSYIATIPIEWEE